MKIPVPKLQSGQTKTAPLHTQNYIKVESLSLMSQRALSDCSLSMETKSLSHDESLELKLYKGDSNRSSINPPPQNLEPTSNLKHSQTIPIRNPEHPFLTYLSGYPALAATTHQLLSWDTSLCIHINRYSSYQRIATFFKLVSRFGDGWFWGIMLMCALVIQLLSGATGLNAWLPILTIALTSAAGVGLYKVLKVKTVRPRPYQVHQVIIMGERPLDVFSFPSGHTLQAVLFTCALGSYFPILLWVMVPFALLIALSRMVLGLHYPTDVAIGGMLGAGLAQMSPIIHRVLLSMLA